VKAVCRSQLQSAFFSSSSPQDVVATGFIALTFVNGGNRKLLTRSLQDEDQSGSASFQVTMSLAGGEQENGGGMSGRIAIGVLGGLVVAGIVGVALFAFLRKRRDEEDRNEEELITTDFVDSPAV
jgi:NhaP-type Na+/H+ or K+/H+ antiporter